MQFYEQSWACLTLREFTLQKIWLEISSNITIHISEDKTGALVSVDDHGAPTPREKTHEERSYGNLNRQDHGHHIPSYYTFKYCLEIMGKNHILIIFLVGVMF